MGKPDAATHVFILRMRRDPVDPQRFMQGVIPAQEAAIKAMEPFGWEFSTGVVELGAWESTSARLGRIAEAHHKHVGDGGLTSGDCNECGLRWPCPTYAWATQDRDPVMSCWDPADDEELTGEQIAGLWAAGGGGSAPYQHSNGQPCYGCQICLDDGEAGDG